MLPLDACVCLAVPYPRSQAVAVAHLSISSKICGFLHHHGGVCTLLLTSCCLHCMCQPITWAGIQFCSQLLGVFLMQIVSWRRILPLEPVRVSPPAQPDCRLSFRSQNVPIFSFFWITITKYAVCRFLLSTCCVRCMCQSISLSRDPACVNIVRPTSAGFLKEIPGANR